MAELLRHKIALIIAALAMAFGVVGCSDNGDTPDQPGGGDDAAFYLRLDVAVTSPGSRASEIAEELEPGVRHENDIADLTIFFFNDPELKGFDALCDADSAFTNIEHTAVPLTPMNSDNTRYQGIIPLMRRPVAGERVIVVANAGSMSGITTLRQLSSHIASRGWASSSNIANCDRFVMSTASTGSEEGIIEIGSHSGKANDPYRVAINIERTASRLDFWFKEGDVSADRKEVVYGVTTSTGTDVARFHLTHIAPVNVMGEATFTLKRASKAATPHDLLDFATCGKEWEGSDGRPVNYIVEPHTILKAMNGSYDLDAWYGTTAADHIRANAATAFTALAGPLQQTAIHGSYTQSGCRSDRYVPLAYANENTQLADCHDSRFLTGLALRGVYEPNVVYTDSAASLVDNRSYASGRDFWRYTPTNRTMDEAESLYFSNLAAATSYRDAHPDEQAEIVAYPGGVCYYNVWIRHHGASTASTDNPHVTYPMEYAIVRNHIYRVSVSFSGPGQPTPRLREPENVISRIFVRKWNVRTQDEIIL